MLKHYGFFHIRKGINFRTSTIKNILMRFSRKYSLLFLLGLGLLGLHCGLAQPASAKYPDPKYANSKTVFPIQLSEAEWKKRLTPEQYTILREEGTERAGTGKYDHFYQKGTY